MWTKIKNWFKKFKFSDVLFDLAFAELRGVVNKWVKDADMSDKNFINNIEIQILNYVNHKFRKVPVLQKVVKEQIIKAFVEIEKIKEQMSNTRKIDLMLDKLENYVRAYFNGKEIK